MTENVPPDKYPAGYTSFVYGLNADKPQILHTMLCVKDLAASERFYVGGLGMKILGRNDFYDMTPRVTGVFVGYHTGQAVLELAHYWDGDGPYSRQPGFGHVAIGVPDVYAVVAKLEGLGAEITAPPAVWIPGAPPTAFLKDPDGYEVEIIQIRNGAAAQD